MPKILRQV